MFGTWSSGSLRAGVDFNHPGPLQFIIDALPVRVLGGGPGLATATALLNVAAVWTIALAGRRIGGGRTALAAAVVTAVLAWNMGSEVLYDAWPPNAVALSFLAMLMLVWAVAVGHLWALVPAAVAASLAAQSQLGFMVLVPGLLAIAAISGVLALRRRRASIGWQPFGATFAVTIVLWAPPLWEQLLGRGQATSHVCWSRVPAATADGSA